MLQGIARIIQRDFFPDLEKLKAQNEYLEATENKDYHRLRELTRKYSGSRPPTEPCKLQLVHFNTIVPICLDTINSLNIFLCSEC